MYKSYDSYASVRERSSAWDNKNFKRHGPLKLIAAPFDLNNLREPLLWGAVGATILGVTASWLTETSPQSTTVWQTGEWYLDEKKVSPANYWLNHSVYFITGNTIGAIGEESVYRGVLHEELSYRLGSNWATIIDTGTFAAMHIATDFARGCSWQYVLVHAADVSVSNLFFDWAYEKGGLPLAVATHAWTNFIANTIISFLYAGAPTNRTTN